MARALTQFAIDALKPSEKRREVPDGKISGLYLVQQPSGAMSWAVRYRAAGKPRKLTVGGPYPATDLAQARKLAQRALADVAAGTDPAAAKQAKRQAEAAERQQDNDRVEKVVETFIERHVRPNTRESSARETERILKREVAAPWKGRRLSSIGRADVHGLLDAIVDRPAPILANRALAALRRMCSWAVERGIISVSPCDRVKAPSTERSRDRVLSDEELTLVWRACDAIGWPFGPLVRLLVLSGQRREEVAGMRWAELDLEAGTWIIPKARTKNGIAHEVPLCVAAVSALKSVHRIKGSEFVFTTTGETPVTGFSKAKERIDAFLLAALDEAPAPWVFHDLRRTMASGMAKLGVNLPVIEKVLNHTSGSFGGIVGVYQRHSFSDEKRQALDAWGAHVERLASV